MKVINRIVESSLTIKALAAKRLYRLNFQAFPTLSAKVIETIFTIRLKAFAFAISVGFV